jgi:hypothetical protein
MVLLIEVALTLGYTKHNLMACVCMCTLLKLHLILSFLTLPETFFLLKEVYGIIISIILISISITIKYNKFLYTDVSNSTNSKP